MRRFRSRAQRVFIWALVLSTLLHFIAGPLSARLFGLPVPLLKAQRPMQTFIVTSSARKIRHRTHPLLPQPVRPPVPQPQPPQPRPQQPQPAPVRPQHRPPPVVLSRRSRNAPPQPRHESLSPSTIAQQERQFSKTIARLRAANNPVLAATQKDVRPSTMRRYNLNLFGMQGAPNEGQGILYPLKRWRVGGYNYYYVRYWVQYPDGSSEEGIVPWPIRFPVGNDPLAAGARSMPLPGPMSNYVPPPGTIMKPLVRFCYERRFPDCPIAHG